MVQKNSPTNKQHVRLAAEYLIASELNRRCFNASIQIGTNVGYDIAAFDNRGHLVYIEVKGSQFPGWMLGEKAKRKRNSKIFYALVAFGAVKITAKPEIFILPAKVVSRILIHNKKLALGLKHFNNEKYRDAWQLLGLKASPRFSHKNKK